MYALADLEPKAVMRWFEEISAIPRGSMKEEKIAAYIMEFARQRGLAVVRMPITMCWCVRRLLLAGNSRRR